MEDEQKGLKKPISENKKTIEMYSQARIEKEEAKIEAEANKAGALSQQQNHYDEIDEMSIDEDEEPEVEKLTVDEDQVAKLDVNAESFAQKPLTK